METFHLFPASLTAGFTFWLPCRVEQVAALSTWCNETHPWHKYLWRLEEKEDLSHSVPERVLGKGLGGLFLYIYIFFSKEICWPQVTLSNCIELEKRTCSGLSGFSIQLFCTLFFFCPLLHNSQFIAVVDTKIWYL